MAAIPVVMISSTARDLPEHRMEVMDGCLRVDMFPKMMEHLAASPDGGLAESMRLVDEAEIYLGIFAHRYGFVPKGDARSITHQEYDRAMERGIPVLIFIMHEDHALKAGDVDKGVGARKLERLKKTLKKRHTVDFFKSRDDLRALVISSLAKINKQRNEAKSPDALEAAQRFHAVSDIPAAPEPYIAHPYTLLPPRGLVGRGEEMSILTDWIAKPEKTSHARVLCVVALGGVGKSALTWKFFNDVLPHEMKPLAGRIWWSFYESDAHFDNFVIRSLAYVSGRSREEVTKLSPPDREDQLLTHLARQPYFVVLDGLERILIAYARMDAAHLADDAYDEQTANWVAGANGLPEGAGPAFVGQQRLRATADLRAGQFLRRLAMMPASGSKVLVSTRLYPVDLQLPNRLPRAGCNALFLPGLSEVDALDLWRAHGAGGARETLLPLFRSFDNHPLLIQALAGEVAANPGKPGDFDHWRAKRKDFNPFQFPNLVSVKSHILEHALRSLAPAQVQVLHTLAAFRMAAGYETVVALLVKSDDGDATTPKPFADQVALDRALTALADRGLLGWDSRPGVNRYDLHPIVRGVVWGGLGPQAQADLYTALHGHFEALPMIEDWRQVNSLEDLTPAIELYNALIGLGRFDDALTVFRDRLELATLYRLSASRQRVELLKRLFPDGRDGLPRLSHAGAQAYALNALAMAYKNSGQARAAVPCLQRAIELDKKAADRQNLRVNLSNLAEVQRVAGKVRFAEASARAALIISRELGDAYSEGVCLQFVGMALLVRGEPDDAAALQRSLRIWIDQGNRQGEGAVNAPLAERAVWRGDPTAARVLADRAWELAAVYRLEQDFISAARLQGTAALFLSDFAIADERLHHALTRARAVNLVQEELPALVALAEWHRRRREPERAREVLDDVWEAAERGPYPLYHADALNVLAQIEWDADHRDAAVNAATEAYRMAWCDGPPFAYHWGLEAARKHLTALGAPEPEMPPFDESKFEPMPEVEINPPDKFAGP